ncbi:MAG: hypothetical protein ACLQVI_18410 [Polyangiaceae bacterium]
MTGLAVVGERATLALACALTACASGTRDIVPETHDVQVTEPGAQGAYAYVARRPLGFVALARESGLGPELAKRATDHLADALDACATNLAAKGKLVEGTIRIDASITRDGSVVVSHMTVSPGDDVAANALLCVMAPLKLTNFPATADSAARGLGIDASWGPQQAAPPRP